MNHQKLTEVQTVDGTLIIDTATRESVLIEKHSPSLSYIDHRKGTLIVDHDTRESVLLEDNSVSPGSEPTGIQA